jgi:trigger factor
MEDISIAKYIELEIAEKKPCLKTAAIKISQENMLKCMDTAVMKAAQLVSIPGFRQGKVPKEIVRNRYSKMIENDLKQVIFEEAVKKLDAMDASVKLLSYIPPDLSQVKLEKDKDFSCNFDFDVLPEISLPSYEALKLETKKKEVSEQDIAERIEFLKKRHGTYNKSGEFPVAEEDMVEVSINSNIIIPDNASPELKRLVKTDKTWIWVKEPEMIPGINKAVVGAKSGETVNFSTQFPQDFREKDLAGKSANYEICIISIHKFTPSDMANVCKKENLSEEELKNNIKNRLDDIAQNQYISTIKQEILDELNKKTPEFPLPELTLNNTVADEFNRIALNAVHENSHEILKDKQDEFMKTAESEAKKKLRDSLIVYKIAQQENIEVKANDIQNEIKNISEMYGVSDAKLKQNLSERKINHLNEAILKEKILDCLFKKLSDKPADKKN